ncbi:RNA polymerase sigma factor [Porticoccus sp. GXU_MW_L64]
MSNQSQKEDQRDLRLLRAVGQGDKDAFSTLYKLYYPLLTRFAYRYLKQLDVIEEVVNDSLLTTWQKAAGFRGDSRVSTWIMGITMRKCWEAARKLDKHSSQDMDTVPEQAVDGELERLDQAQAIEHALEYLSADQRACVELAYQSGYTCEEIGQIMECPANTVKTRLFHARKIFKKVFGQQAEPIPAVEGNTP